MPGSMTTSSSAVALDESAAVGKLTLTQKKHSPHHLFHVQKTEHDIANPLLIIVWFLLYISTRLRKIIFSSPLLYPKSRRRGYIFLFATELGMLLCFLFFHFCKFSFVFSLVGSSFTFFPFSEV